MVNPILSTVVVAMLVTLGCAGALTTRTGAIYDVKIEEDVKPTDLAVHIGDEIRWVNHRTAPVKIDFLGNALTEVSCRQGFTNFLGLKRDTATLEANESVSLCFSKPGVVTYNIRMTSAVPGGQQIVPAQIRVGVSPQ